MIKSVGTFPVVFFFLCVIQSGKLYSSEQLLKASVSANVNYNDNIFLSSSSQQSASSVVVIPSLKVAIKEKNWEAKLNSQLRINQYSDHDLDSNEELFDLSSQYSAERNIFSINIAHNLFSSLNTISSDFAISRQKIERKAQSVTPQYTRFLTERLVLTLSYSYSDTEYLDIEKDTRFVSSYTETGSAALRYNLTEKDQVSLNFQAVDYTRKDKLGDIQLFDANVSFDHKFSEILSMDLAVGRSKRDSTNLQTTTLDFFGTTIIVPQEINTKTRGINLNLGIKQLLESGSVSARVSRNTTTNSFGGLNETSKLAIDYNERLSDLWRYSVAVSYDDISSENVATTFTNREVVIMEASTFYSLSRDWHMSFSYSYRQRKFESISSDESRPYSNRMQVGLKYNFPLLSTF